MKGAAHSQPMSAKPIKRASTPPGELGHQWYLREWCTFLGKIQADTQRELGWPRAKASNLWNGKQRYTQETVDEVSAWLGVEPFELLMPPGEALAIRQLRSAARTIVDSSAAFSPTPTKPS